MSDDTNVSSSAMEGDDSMPGRDSILDPALLRCLFDEAPDGIALSDTNTRYVEVNTRFCEIVGRTREQLLGMTIADLVVPEELEDVRAAMRQEGEGHRHEWRIRHGDGREVYIEASSRMLSSGHWVAHVRDVSVRQRADDARRKTAERADAERRWLRAVLDTVPLGMLILEPDGTIVSNAHAEALLGMTLSPEGGVTQYRNRILHRDGRPMSPDELISTRVMRDGETVLGADGLIEHPDGSRIPILGSAAPIRDADGTITGGVAVFQDISQRLHDEELIRANEQLLEGIFELLPVGVWIADRTGRIVRANPAGKRIWRGARYVGLSEFGEYRGWWADTGEPIAAEEWALARAVTKGETSLGELIRIQCFDGSFKTILNSALPLRDEQGQCSGAIVVNEDVTELREIQETLRRAVQARDEMLQIVSHDLRNPLSTIVLSAQVIGIQAESITATPPIGNTAGRILRVAQGMARLVDDLLDLASIEAGQLGLQPGPFLAQQLLREAVDAHQAQAESSTIQLVVADASTPSPIMADHDRVLQALGNLVGNAIKFSPSGGRVLIRVDDDGDDVRFSVDDSGPGIPAEEVAHVFDRFWQKDSADRRGRGLGLAITKGIVEAHGGRIWIESESESGHGTCVCFTLPKSSTPTD